MSNGTTKTLSVLAVIGAIAFATNPDEVSFSKFIETSMKKQGSTWFERKLTSKVSAIVNERKDFKFFSLVDVAEQDMTYLGIFGIWICLPKSWDDVKRMIQF